MKQLLQTTALILNNTLMWTFQDT